MSILSIQSSVAYGHVGNSAVVFPLQRMGHEVWPVNTVHFSNHTGYGRWKGPVLPADQIANVIRGIDELGVLPQCRAVLSGYTGSVPLGEVILDAVDRARRANPAAIYCCDPVMGDIGRGFYVHADLPAFFRDRALPEAQIIAPNQFELEFLAGAKVNDLDGALAAADRLRRLGPDIVLVTSLRRNDAPGERIEMLAVTDDGAWLVASPLLPLSVNGAGDAASALFLAHWLETRSAAEALQRMTGAVFAILQATLAAGSREIQLVAAQDAITNPPQIFHPEKVR